jgi:LCP family protein required for cell wall assembly
MDYEGKLISAKHHLPLTAIHRGPPKPIRRSFNAPCYNPSDSDDFEVMEPNYTRRPRQTIAISPVMWGLAAAFLVAVSVTVYLTYAAIRQLSQTRLGSDLPYTSSLDVGNPSGEPLVAIDNTNPLQGGSGPAPQTWDGAGRVTILVMGLDYRDWEGEGPSHTDTMILFTMDPSNHTAGMLSIPRDLWVNIPGFDYGKINTAYFLGELYQTPGGGPGLAIETVENFLGIDINYYAQVDFSAFERFIDEIGGVEVNVPEDLSVDPIGPGNTVYLTAGANTLDGPTALAYARYREDSDINRIERQQQVILAIRNRILSLDMLPTLVTRAPQLYQMLAAGVNSNLTLGEVVSLAYEAAKVPAENITRRAIGWDQSTQTYTPDGLDILQPDLEAILQLRDDVFFNTEPIAPAATEIIGNLEELMRAESATISILNATTTPGLASRATEYLRSLSINVSITDNATNTEAVTTIIDYTGKPYTVQYLVDLLEIDPSNIYSRYDPYSPVDIAILIGADWVDNNPLP